MSTPRYTFVWWGDGYMVYDGNEYIGADDQIDELDLLMSVGGARRIDAEDQPEVTEDYWGVPLPILKKEAAKGFAEWYKEALLAEALAG